MKRFITSLVIAFLALSCATANAQLIYGNTFPFWNVNGPLTVVGATKTSTLEVTGTTTLTGAVTMSGLVSAEDTNFTGSGVTMSGGTSWNVFNTNATTVAAFGAATTITMGAATGTLTVGPAIVGSITTESTSATTGAIKTAGGLGVAKNLSVGGHVAVSSGATTITSGDCGTTTNGTVAGTDTSGLITIGAVATTACKVSFAAAIAAAPKACVITAGNAAAIAATALPYISAITTTYFTITGAVLASTNWYYLCI